MATASAKYGIRGEAGRDKTGAYPYIVTGASTLADAIAAIEAEAPATIGDTVFDHAEATELEGGGGRWDGFAHYVHESAAFEETNSQFSFEITGGSQKVLYSKATVGAYNSSGAVTSPFGGAINAKVVDGKVEIDGVEIGAAEYRFSETHYLSNDDVTDAYKGILFALYNRYNAATFRGLAAGECLFKGATGTRTRGGLWQITYNFSGLPNATSLVIGDITVPSKKGWDYLWVHYSPTANATLKMMGAAPDLAIVDQVYDEGDFTLLGI